MRVIPAVVAAIVFIIALGFAGAAIWFFIAAGVTDYKAALASFSFASAALWVFRFSIKKIYQAGT